MDPVEKACELLRDVLRARAPYKTGHLAVDGIRIVGSSVVIGGEEAAPYAVYTNEPWTSEKWHGKKNPNEGWVQRAVREAAPLIQRVLNGQLSEEDVARAMKEYRDIFAERQEHYAEYLKTHRNALVTRRAKLDDI